MSGAARVRCVQLCDLDTVRVLEGATGELVSYAQDGQTVLVRWDWAVEMPPTRGAFVPMFGLEAAVDASAVVAVDAS